MGPYSGTPFRTLPARKKPLIKLDSDYYAVDPCFTPRCGISSAALNLLAVRKPEYKKDFEVRQKTMSEARFSRFLFSINGRYCPSGSLLQRPRD